MVRINLIPTELLETRDKSIDFKAIFLIGIVIFVIAALEIGAWSVINAFNNKKIKQLEKLQRDEKEIATFRKEEEALKQEITSLRVRNQALKDFTSRRLQWADRLYRLGELLPEEIWLKSLNINMTKRRFTSSGLVRTGKMVLVGELFVFSPFDKELTVLDKMMKSLEQFVKENPGMSDPNLVESLTAGSVKNKDIPSMRFTVEIPFVL